MKPATDQTDSGIVETTIRKRIVPLSEGQDSKTPDLWEYLRGIQDWSKHMVYGYRIEPGPRVQIFRCSEQLVTMPSGRRVPIFDEQELEYALTQEFGGGVYRLMVKKGPQIITAGNLEIGTPPRQIRIPVDGNQSGPVNSNPANFGSDTTAMIANKAIDTVAGAEHQAVRIGIDALGAAANIVRSFGEGRPAAAPQDDMTQQFMRILIARAMEDPFEKFMKFFTLMREMSPPGAGGGTGGPLVEKLLGAAVDRFMNPAPSGAPVSASAELMRQLPQLGTHVAESLREFRMAREAEVRIVAMQRGQSPPPPASQAQVLPGATAEQQPANGQPTMEFVEQKIVEILRQPVSADQAADDAMTFLGALDANSLAQFAALGENGLLALFQSRPILKQACNNMPRLVEFIRAFLKMHVEDQAAEEVPPPAPNPPLPN